jgi:hypothetical protein
VAAPSWLTSTISMAIPILIRCLHCVADTPALKATSTALKSPISRWKGQCFQLQLLLLASPVFPVTILTVRSQTGGGIVICGGVGSTDGRAGAVADNNQAAAIVEQNTVADNTHQGIWLCAEGGGLASANTIEVRTVHNTSCHNGTDILGEGGFTGNVLFPVPNAGTGNVLEGEIFKNTATTVTVDDGVPGNTATVTQFKNDPCPE